MTEAYGGGSASTGAVLSGDTLVAGNACADVLVLGKPLSFWGGYDSAAGRIIDRGHPLVGASLAGRIMVMAHAKGSSSSSSVLAEAVRNGTGPVGIVLKERDLIISIGAIVAAELYAIEVPVVCVAEDVYDAIVNASGPVRIEAAGGIGGATISVGAAARRG
ncbi:aconitase X swivel domain-containing protein [Burkholderia ubonensis]|uniref:aconitase X swivel domain-containing protein n=1 Tax=Burkholderia ubonensis TaxID=101571 RepID=UPI00358EFF8B